MAKRTAVQKILGILECIKDRYDISPSGSYTTHVRGAYLYRRPEREIRIDTDDLMTAGDVDFYELESILAKLQELGLIEKFRNLADYE